MSWMVSEAGVGGSEAMAMDLPTMLPNADAATPSSSSSTAILGPEVAMAKGKAKAKPKSKAKPKDPNAPPSAPKKRKKKDSVGTSQAESSKTASGTGDVAQHSDQMFPGSWAGSLAPSQALISGDGGGSNTTPTKRKASAKGSKAKGRASTRGESRGSRGTSARGSASVAPGQAVAQIQGPTHEDEEGNVDAQDEEPDNEEGAEEEEEEDEDVGDQQLEEDAWQRQEAMQKAKSIAMGPLIKAMDAAQYDRYSLYRRSFLDKRHVRRLLNHLTGQNTTQQVTSLAASMAKIFVGEIVEKARHIQTQKGGSGALKPEHLLEAHRLYKEERDVPGRLPPGAPAAGAGTGGNGRKRRLF